MVHAIAVGACSTAGGGAGDKVSFIAPSNKENESNVDVQSPRRPLLQGVPSPQFRPSSENNAPSSLSTTNKTKKRSFSEVDNTDTHGNEGLSNVLLMGYDRCTKFFRGALSRIPLFGTATNDSATSNNDQRNEGKIIPFRLSDGHHRQRQTELLRQRALQFHAARDTDERLGQKKYSDRIGPPLPGGIDIPLVTTTTKSVTWCEEVQLFEYEQTDGIDADIECGSSDDSSDEKDDYAELDETVEEIVPQEEAEEEDNRAGNYDKDGLQNSDGETLENLADDNPPTSSPSFCCATDLRAGTMVDDDEYEVEQSYMQQDEEVLFDAGTGDEEMLSHKDEEESQEEEQVELPEKMQVQDEEDLVPQSPSFGQHDEEGPSDDGTGDEAMRQDEEESREDAMLDAEEEEEQMELQEEMQVQERGREQDQDGEDLAPSDLSFADVKCHLGDLMDDALDVNDPGECMPFYFLSW